MQLDADGFGVRMIEVCEDVERSAPRGSASLVITGFVVRVAEVIDAAGEPAHAAVLTRGQMTWAGKSPGPALLIDPEATTFIPGGWMARAQDDGAVVVERMES